MFYFNFLAKLISVLHSGEEPKHLAAGFALGSIIGLTPLNSLHNLIIFCLILLLNVSISAATFGIFVFSLFAYLLDPIFHNIGYFFLVKVEFLRPCWTYLYNIPIAPLTRFNNTVVLGSFVSSLVLLLPVYLGFKNLVLYYRIHYAEKVNQWKIMKIIKGSNLVQLYNKIKFNSF
ncbi:MAG: TIGR03546 family protein [Bacillota bacterium]